MMTQKQLFGYLLVLPLVLAIWAGWQMIRIQQKTDVSERTVVKVQQAIREMEGLQKKIRWR